MKDEHGDDGRRVGVCPFAALTSQVCINTTRGHLAGVQQHTTSTLQVYTLRAPAVTLQVYARRTLTATLQVYSIDLQELPVGEYAVTATLTTEAGNHVGEKTHLWWSLSECARHGKSCQDSETGHVISGGFDSEKGNVAVDDGANNAQHVGMDSGGMRGNKDRGLHDGSSYSDALRQACPALGRTDEGYCDTLQTCTGHGRCQNGVCVCEAGYMGQYCTHHVYSNASYLPTRNPVSWPGTCVQAYVWQQGARRLVAALQQITRSDSCNGGQIIKFNTRMHGMGAQVCTYSCTEMEMM
jgi:hypothetical protein